ncbi:aminotransferase class-III (plasmid) [Gloeothece citriformis PCC 7424]|uniref:Aminotransferase class-III n=1 Tax=Gloeothece citriformis (strain PCC 7424) TaxID=65393 RepID=B7KLZ2_GLOC7|nr:aspartate aminotransferase family protein [Gloeothece citriformis]ACK73814.1 aminotransferase class-III [Gloeothece citriformis PCC 7424]
MNVKEINTTIPQSALLKANLTSKQQEHIESLIWRYTQKTANSKRLTQKYRTVLADPRNASGFNLLLKEMYYPTIGEKAIGSKIWDIDGNEYLDFTMGFGVNLLGHNPPLIKAALQEQLTKGIQLGPQAELAGEVAQLICELTGMERVAISNTGTEAVMAALRIARAATGRQKTVIFSGSYHGHFDGTLAKIKTVENTKKVVPKYPGVPSNWVQDILVLKYGEFESLDIIKTHAEELAAVIVEPVQASNINLQPHDFLHQLRQLTQELGIVLIFDEMVTGFRIHLGGAQAWFGVKADLATYGKIVGGGLPIGIIAGKATYLDHIDGGWWNYGDESKPQTETTFLAGTYCKHPLTMASARAILQYLKAQGNQLQEQLNQRTSKFVARLNAYFDADGVPLQMTNFGSLFGRCFSANSITNSQSLNLQNSALLIVNELLSYHLLDEGVFLRGSSGFLSTAHSEKNLDDVIESVKSSIEKLRQGGFLI